MSHHPAGPLQSSKGGAGAPAKTMTSNDAQPEQAAPAETNDSDASETSHSEPGLEPWSRPAAGQAGPQPFATQRPSKRQRSGSLGPHSTQPSVRDDKLGTSAGGLVESAKDIILNGTARGAAADLEARGGADAEAQADQLLLQRTHDASACTPDGQLNRLEAILTCLKKPHLLHQPQADSASVPQGRTITDAAPGLRPSAGITAADLAHAVARIRPASEVPPASGAPQAAASALAPAGASVPGADADAEGPVSDMQVAAESAAMDDRRARLVPDGVPRPGRRSRPPPEVSAGDVSPKDTSLLAFFAAAAQQEGAEVRLKLLNRRVSPCILSCLARCPSNLSSSARCNPQVQCIT